MKTHLINNHNFTYEDDLKNIGFENDNVLKKILQIRKQKNIKKN